MVFREKQIKKWRVVNMKFEITPKFKKFQRSPWMRRKVVKELEASGTIARLPKEEYEWFVFNRDYKPNKRGL